MAERLRAAPGVAEGQIWGGRDARDTMDDVETATLCVRRRGAWHKGQFARCMVLKQLRRHPCRSQRGEVCRWCRRAQWLPCDEKQQQQPPSAVVPAPKDAVCKCAIARDCWEGPAAARRASIIISCARCCASSVCNADLCFPFCCHNLARKAPQPLLPSVLPLHSRQDLQASPIHRPRDLRVDGNR
ncbi:hypothetical protein BU26DRAFT_50933 [Trematosphaeria pertusa]|uniref:Uncharacterized protein n=1 Tax=Trematosphaeria pertusa TaxID=390896 RepID=A0A6A6I9R2_9PLEO|nr:uncharacterized protein BU26DRAFT_50933 [Trematosphaeria pertusa]KAF2246662.1 hypothetical protein BU26DRAFT_50933 [Trematosphaeria pertusa]